MRRALAGLLRALALAVYDDGLPREAITFFDHDTQGDPLKFEVFLRRNLWAWRVYTTRKTVASGWATSLSVAEECMDHAVSKLTDPYWPRKPNQ